MPSAEEIYLFRHAAYREVAYRLQMPSDRAELHAHALEIMEQVFQFDIEKFAHELAEHARLAREQGADKPSLAEREARYVIQAVKRARERAQWSIVVALTEQALGCPALQVSERLDMDQNRARALRAAGRISESEQLSLQLVEQARDQGNELVELQSMVDAASVRIARGALKEGIELLEQAERLGEKFAREGKPDLLANTYIQRSLATSNFEEVQAWLDKASDAIQGHEESSTWSAVQGNLANHLGAQGRHGEAIGILRGLVQAFEKMDDKHNVSIAWANIGRQELLRGDNAAAEVALSSGIRVAQEVGNSRTEAFARANLATLQMRRGALDEAGVNITRAIEIARDHELHAYLAAYLCGAAELALLRGHEKEAQETIENARAEFVSSGHDAFSVEYCGTVRLRIAASQAVSTGTPGRATSRLTGSPPSPMWVRVVRDLLSELTKEAESRGRGMGPLLEQGIAAGTALLAELDTAVREKRPALVYRGYLPSEMQPALRAELARCILPAEAAALKALHPALLKALQD